MYCVKNSVIEFCTNPVYKQHRIISLRGLKRSKRAWVRFTTKQVKIVSARVAITIFTDVPLVFNLLCGYTMKEKFTTIDLFAILRELRERCVATKQFTSVGSLLLPLGVNYHSVCVMFFVGAEFLG